MCLLFIRLQAYSTKSAAAGSKGPELVNPSRRSESPELLASDDEDSSLLVPHTLRTVPSHLPPLPPKHTYLRTPVGHSHTVPQIQY